MIRRARIIATIGPSSQDEATLRQLILAGMDVARLNFSHGSQTEHAAVYERLRRLSTQLDHPVAILQDLQGPKIRIGSLKDGKAELKYGQPFTLTSQPIMGDDQRASVDYPDLTSIIIPGSHILLDDGNIELQVNSVSGDQVETTVLLGGILKPHKGVNLPGAPLNIPGLTEKDLSDLEFGLQLGVDAIAISFVRTSQDVQHVRQIVSEKAPDRRHIPIIAKLERPEALQNLDDILQCAEGVMVARGDMAVELSPQVVPIAQKRIIQAANRHLRLVITATQMLDSMINNPRPTRAEASDVANAIFDGTDAVMLSGETASGKHPLQAVEMMDSIVCQAEQHLREWGHWPGQLEPEDECDDAYYIARAANDLTRDRNVTAIAVFTRSGRTARLLSKFRPRVPILAFTPDPITYNRLGLYWGVKQQLVPPSHTVEQMLTAVEECMLASASVQRGQQVVLVCGYPVVSSPGANLTMLYTLGG